MPELPEVETIRRHLAPHVEGRTLERLEIRDPRWSRPLAPRELADALERRTIERLSRRGKYLVWELEDEASAPWRNPSCRNGMSRFFTSPRSE